MTSVTLPKIAEMPETTDAAAVPAYFCTSAMMEEASLLRSGIIGAMASCTSG